MYLGWHKPALRTLLFIIICHKLMSKVDTFCAFDEIQPPNLPKQRVQYEHDFRDKRSVSQDKYEPIRIAIKYHDLDEELSDDQQLRMKTDLDKVIRKAQQIFSVKRVKKPLLLSRSSEACNIVFQSGINAGKCAGVRDSYRGEICIDDFLIPDDHLEGLEVYNETYAKPIKKIKEKGHGVANTDFILYIRSLSTETCLHSVLPTTAYASFCHLDQNNRPLAGYVNFCPHLLSDEKYNEDKFYYTALHELFHALGFSNKLYEKFQKCEGPENCYNRKNPVQTVLGEKRLVTPKVVELTSKHFGCSTQEAVNRFGPMLETKESRVYSHWDGAFMFSSIMTAKLGLPEEIIVDAITLAVFEDTGWYKVDYTQAENFPWGEDGGCNWGKHPACIDMDMDEECFCTMEKKNACHYLYFGKGVCETDIFLHGCYVYKTTPQDLCTDPLNSPNSMTISATGELYTDNSRCFVANLTASSHILLSPMSASEGMSEGRCYQTRCNKTILQVKVGDSPWVECPDEKTITIPGYLGMLHCPHTNILCPPTPVTSKPVTSTTPRQPSSSSTLSNVVVNRTNPGITTTAFVVQDSLAVICIDIRFTSLGYDYLVATNQVSQFREACLYKTMEVTGVSRRRINNMLVLKGSVLFRFDLVPAQYAGDGPTTKRAIEILMDLIKKGNFSISLTPDGSVYVASSLFQIEGGPQLSQDQTPKGVVAGVVIGSIIAAIVIATAVFFVQRYYAIRSQMTSGVQRTPATNPAAVQSTTSRESQNATRSGNITIVNANGEPLNRSSNTQSNTNEYSVETSDDSGVANMPSLQRKQVSDLVVTGHSSIRTNVKFGSSDNVRANMRRGQILENACRTPPDFATTRPASGLSVGDQSNSSPVNHFSRSSSRSQCSVIYNSANGIANIASSPHMLRNSAVQGSPRAQTLAQKPCALKCKCEWLKHKFKRGSRNKSTKTDAVNRPSSAHVDISQVPEGVNPSFTNTSSPAVMRNGYSSGYHSSPISNYYSDYSDFDNTNLERNQYYASFPRERSSFPRYPPSIVQCSGSPVVAKRDYNSNLYPHYVSLEDMKSPVSDYHCQSNPAPSVDIGSISSDDISRKQYTTNSMRESPVFNSSENVTCSTIFVSDGPEIQDNNPTQQSYNGHDSRISHRSSCNSFADSDEHPFYTTSIEIPQTGAQITELPPNKIPYYPSKITSSVVDITGSQSTIDTKGSDSGIPSAAASDIDVSFLAKNVEFSGNRCSTTSWHSFSSDTSLDSSVIHIKR